MTSMNTWRDAFADSPPTDAEIIAHYGHAASRRNPRNQTCPGCGKKNALTPSDCARGWVCDACEDLED